MAYRSRITGRRIFHSALTLTLATLVVVMPNAASAYHFFYLMSPVPVPIAWRTLPINPILDIGPAAMQARVQAAMNEWNAVPTAVDMFGTSTVSTVDFTAANFGTAWGNKTDGKFEIVCDTDGSIFALMGSAPGTLGQASWHATVVGGRGTIVDGFFVLNCAAAESTWVGIMVHEFGHNLGLAHTPVYQPGLKDALKPVSMANAPTMYPFLTAGIATLEEDDKAGISELYPDATFNAVYGTVSGKVTRCFTNEPVIGAVVRAVNTATNATQFTRYTGYDGNATGSYDMKVKAGTYHLIIETLALELPRMAVVRPIGPATRVDTDFATEYRSPPAEEENCTEPMPDVPTDVVVPAGDPTAGDGGSDPLFAAITANQDFKTNPVDLAFVVDDTGSMGPEIAAVRMTLTNEINRLKAIPGLPYPTTAIVTFKDSVTVRRISRDPAVLQAAVNALTASGGGDCPEWSNDALMVAGRLLRKEGKAMLFTDADSHPTGATTAAVAALYTSKSLRASVLLSGTCSGSGFDTTADARSGNGMDPRHSQNPETIEEDPAGDLFPPGPTLGFQSSIETNAAIVRATGGMFAAIPGIKSRNATETARYINTGTNIAVSASIPTVGLITPGDGPRGTTIDIDIEGSTTNFQSSSAVSFSGGGITLNSRTVRSPTVITANITIASDAALGFRDVTVTTALGGASVETATGIGAFNVTSAPTSATIVSVTPNSAARGQTVNVTIKGAATSFTNASIPIFCRFSCRATGSHDPKVQVNSSTAVDATTLNVNITVAADATISYRNVSVITGAQIASESVVGPFLVAPSAVTIPTLTSIAPNAASLGQTLNVSVVGNNTNFVNGGSALSFSGTGITVNSTTVTSQTTLTASITVTAGAMPGFRDVFVTTSGETAVLLNGFNLLGGSPTAQPPTSLYAASIEGNLVTLRFTPPAFGLPPTSYALEGGVNPGEVLASLPFDASAPITRFMAPTGAFYVRVRTVSGSSVSPASNEIRIYVNVPATPSAPANLTGMVNGNTLALTWRDTFGGGTPAAHFLDVTGTLSASLALPAGETFSFAGVPPGTYTLSVRSANAAGISTSSNPVTLTFPGPCSGAPLPPSNFLAYRMGNQVTVLWEPPTTGRAATSYQLLVGGSLSLSIPTAGRLLSGAVPAGTYNLSVRAVNACGNSPYTPVQTIVVP